VLFFGGIAKKAEKLSEQIPALQEENFPHPTINFHHIYDIMKGQIQSLGV